MPATLDQGPLKLFGVTAFKADSIYIPRFSDTYLRQKEASLLSLHLHSISGFELWLGLKLAKNPKGLWILINIIA